MVVYSRPRNGYTVATCLQMVVVLCVLCLQAIASYSSSLEILERRAQAWTHCIRSVPVPNVTATCSFHASICRLPTRTLGHIHVYKNGGTVLNEMVERACDFLNGSFAIINSQRSLAHLLRTTKHPTLLFTAQRDPVERFYSSVAEVARRGKLITEVRRYAETIKDPAAALYWMITHRSRQRLARGDVHFSQAIDFLIQGSSKPGEYARPWPLDYVVAIHHAEELQLVWDSLLGGLDCPFPADLHGRHHQDTEYELCLEGGKECAHATNVTRHAIPYLLMEPSESTAMMNTTLQQGWYRHDQECYQEAEQGALLALNRNN